MVFYNRGQGATEYLVILGAVLLVSIVVVNAMSAFPSSQSSIKQQQSQAYWSSLTPIKILSAKVVDANLVLGLQNTGSATIRLDGVNIGNASVPIYPYYSGDYYGPAYCFRPNENLSATMSCSLIMGPGEISYVAAQGAGVISCANKSGTEISDVRMVYSVGGSSISNFVLKGDKPLIVSCSTRQCDVNWSIVPGNPALLVNDFCVMKYEAKCSNSLGGNGSVGNCTGQTPLSQSDNRPWVYVNQTEAAAACARLGAGYHLMRDREWSTMATDLSGVAANWFVANNGSSNGKSCLFGGHMDGSPSAPQNASFDDNYGWWNGTSNASGTTANCPFIAYANGLEGRRTMYLSNGQVVWDVSGNVREWTDASFFENLTGTGALGNDTAGATAGMPTNSVDNTSNDWFEFPTVVDWKGLGYDRLPNSTWNSSFGVGMVSLDPGMASNGTGYNGTTHVVARGGFCNRYEKAGIFEIVTEYSPSASNSNFGFRCAR